ncbi:MAG: (d)CMP kinase [Muribaculaceae bacterium]|nr:(d)CMP kinase [Muribaculaceae bacterium]MEE1297414.1 (d)CMP kinase [Muribaculaceae bacterium]
MEKKLITIAIDGFSSSGKSTMAKVLAKNIGYAYIDTGAMYRAVTLYCIDNGLIDSDNVNTAQLEKKINDIAISFSVDPETGASVTMLNGKNVEKEIRDMRVSGKVSVVAAIPFVRRALVKQQQQMGDSKGIVMDGRDIGTVVFPNAEMKVYVDASPETRAQRRFDELKAKGDASITYEEVLENVKYRDHLDQTREESPLRKAEDAIVLDNSHMTPDEQNKWLLDLYNSIINRL